MARKAFAIVSLLTVLSLLMASCAPAATPAPAATEVPTAAPAGEIKIGIVSVFTGVFAAFGEMQRSGYLLALEEYNYTVAGKKIKIIEEDDQLNYELAVTKAKKLVEQDKVDILTGLVSGDEGLTVQDYMKDKPIPIIPMYSAPEDMTMRLFTFNTLRPTWTGAQPMDPFGYWLAKEKGYKKVYMIGEDYSYPYNQAGGFKRGFCRGGGEEVTTVWHPVPMDDYSSIIAAIPLDKGYDAVIYNGAGSDAVSFVKQYLDLGMQKKIPLLGQSNTFERPDVFSMPEIVAEIEGYSPHLVADDLNTPEWNKFKEAYVKRWNKPPSAAAEFAYVCMLMILRGIEKLNGDVSDKKALVEAMASVDLSDAPRGPVKLDQYHAAIENVYIRVTAKLPDGLGNKGVVTIKNVSQFGPYDPQVYMKQPPDDKNYPPDKCSEMPAEMLKVEKDYEFVPFGQ